MCITYDKSELSTSIYEYVKSQLERLGNTVIGILINDEIANIDGSLVTFPLIMPDGGVVLSLLQGTVSKELLLALYRHNIVEPEYYIMCYFYDSIVTSYYVDAPLNVYVWTYSSHTDNEQYKFIESMFSNMLYSDEKALLSFSVMELWYSEVIVKNIHDMKDLLEHMYNKAFTTVMGEIKFEPSNTISNTLSLFYFDGTLNEYYDSDYYAVTTIYNFYKEPVLLCDWISYKESGGISEKKVIKVAILHSVYGSEAAYGKSWFLGFETAVQYVNQKLHDFTIQLKIFNDDSDKAKRIKQLEIIYEDYKDIQVIFGCRTYQCLYQVREIVKQHPDKLFITTARTVGMTCDKNIILTGGTPNQFLEPAINHAISFDIFSKVYFIGMNDEFCHLLYNMIVSIYGGLIEVKGSYFVNDTQYVVDSSKMYEAKEALGESGLFVVALSSSILVNFVKSFQKYQFDKKLYGIFTLINEPNELIDSVSPEEYENIYFIGSYFENMETDYSETIKYYLTSKKFSVSFAKSFQTFLLWSNSYFTIDKENPTVDEMREKMYNTPIKGIRNTVQLYNNNYLSQSVLTIQMKIDGSYDITVPESDIIIPRDFDILYEYSYNKKCDLDTGEIVAEDVRMILFPVSLTGEDSNYYKGIMSIIDIFINTVSNDNILPYLLSYIVKDIKSDDETCISIINEYKSKVISIFGTPTKKCSESIDLDDSDILLFNFGVQSADVCRRNYFFTYLDVSQYNEPISSIAYTDIEGIAVIGWEKHVDYITYLLNILQVNLIWKKYVTIDTDPNEILDDPDVEIPKHITIIYCGPYVFNKAFQSLLKERLGFVIGDIEYISFTDTISNIEGLDLTTFYYLPYFTGIESETNRKFTDSISTLVGNAEISAEMEILYTSV